MKYLLLYILFAFLVLGASYEEILNDKNSQLENIKQDVEGSKKIIAENKNKTESLNRQIDSVNTELEALNKFLKDYENEKFLTALEIAQEANIVLFLEEEVEKIQESFRNKIVNLYKHGKNYELELLLSAKSPNEFLRRNQYLQKFSQNRLKELKELKTKKFILDEKKKMLNLSTSSQRFYVESRRNQRAQLEAKISDLFRLKSELDDENKSNEYKTGLKQKEQVNVQNFIKNFTEKKNTFKGSKTSRVNYPSQVFEQLKSLLNIPVDIGMVKNEFGEYTDNATSTVSFNNGIDFSIAKGSKVYSAANGTVEIAGELPYYGRVVIVNHDNGYRTVYAILNEILVNPGDGVRTNQLLGRTGENQDGQAFHFEIWKDRTPVNPREWIRF
jgi:septal ring factor EnvC (AmiA/AmiB activator)